MVDRLNLEVFQDGSGRTIKRRWNSSKASTSAAIPTSLGNAASTTCFVTICSATLMITRLSSATQALPRSRRYDGARENGPCVPHCNAKSDRLRRGEKTPTVVSKKPGTRKSEEHNRRLNSVPALGCLDGRLVPNPSPPRSSTDNSIQEVKIVVVELCGSKMVSLRRG
jgi:hypothetical protein